MTIQKIINQIRRQEEEIEDAEIIEEFKDKTDDRETPLFLGDY